MLQRHNHILIEQDPTNGKINVYTISPVRMNMTPPEAGQLVGFLLQQNTMMGAAFPGMGFQMPMAPMPAMGLPFTGATGAPSIDGAASPLVFGNIASLQLPHGSSDQRIRAVLLRRKGMEDVSDPRYEFKKKEVDKLVGDAFRGVKDVKLARRTSLDAENGPEADELIERYFWIKVRPDSKFDLKELNNAVKPALGDYVVSLVDSDGVFTGIKIILANPREKVVKEKGYERVEKLAERLTQQGHVVQQMVRGRDGVTLKTLNEAQRSIAGFGAQV